MNNDLDNLHVRVAVLETQYLNLEKTIRESFARLEKKLDKQAETDKEFVKDIKVLKEWSSKWRGIIAFVLGFGGFIGGLLALTKYIKW